MDTDPTTAAYSRAAIAGHAPVSWGAILAGAVASLALLILLSLLAAGFGLTFGFPGAATPNALAAFTPVAGAWMVAAQVVASALGGYLAGRLRTVWGVHSDEAHFRDTAHGLLAWAVSTVAGSILAITVLAPYAERMAGAATVASALGASGGDLALAAARQAHIAAQCSFFAAVGLLLGAFMAAVAAALGGLRNEEMHGKL